MYENLIDDMIMYRAKHKLSQPEFAEKAGVSVQTVCHIETGQQKPSKITVAKIRLAMQEEKEEKDEG